MPRTPDVEMKRELLDRVVAYLASTGIGDMSLRPMANALGTSTHRLAHHFGSKQELLEAALKRAIRIQEGARDGWSAVEPNLGPTDVLRKWWQWLLASPANLALTRLGLEAVTLEATHSGLSKEVRAEQISVWREDIEMRLRQTGLPREAAVVEATVLKTMFNGMIVDLLATGDRARLSEALEIALRRAEIVLAAPPEVA